MPRLSSLVTILSLAVASTSANDGESTTKSCPMWLAPSYTNLQGVTEFKYGLYAGKTYEKDSVLPLAELAIPIIDFFVQFNQKKPLGEDVVPFLETVVWEQEKIGSQWEGSLGAPALIPGIGMLANYHETYSNAEFLEASVLLREHGEEFPEAGHASLVRGAVTPYFNVTLQASKRIPRGMEVFLDFGHNWQELQPNMYQNQIHAYDYELADKIVDKLLALFEKHPDLSLDTKEDVMEFFMQKILASVAGPDGKSAGSLIPENPRKLQQVKDAGGTFLHRYRDIIRSDEWLENNGFCLDTIRPGVSTIPNAGRGAFADRNISKGSNIVLSPLLHIANKHLLAMHPIVDNEFVEQQEPTKAQILLNYAFGHRDSDMVFVPTAPHAMLINHAGKKANAHIDWADENDEIHNPINYFATTIEDMAGTKYTPMILKVVADRDIAEGEEITIDYGESWQEAWNEYETNWRKTKEGKPHPLKAEDVKKLYKDKPLEMSDYLKDHPYPDGVFAACYMTIQEFDDGMPMTHPENGAEINNFLEPTAFEQYDANVLYYVDVLGRTEAPGFFYNYTVRAALADDNWADVHNVPHSACTFMDREYTSDLHIEGAFRHVIGLPDDMVPILWRY